MRRVGQSRDHGRKMINGRLRHHHLPDFRRRIVPGSGFDPKAKKFNFLGAKRLLVLRHAGFQFAREHRDHQAPIGIAGNQGAPALAAGQQPAVVGEIQVSPFQSRLVATLAAPLHDGPDIVKIARLSRRLFLVRFLPKGDTDAPPQAA